MEGPTLVRNNIKTQKERRPSKMGLSTKLLVAIAFLSLLHLAVADHHHLHSYHEHADLQNSINSDPSHPHTMIEPVQSKVNISFETRVHWMRRARSALYELTSSPCPFGAFGAAIVNHTAIPEGELVCIGVNTIAFKGDPTQHGETAAISNCTSIFTDPNGPYKLSAAEAVQAFSTLSLYTTAEPCPMCSAAIRWASFSECIYATSGTTLTNLGWSQIGISSFELFARSEKGLGTKTGLIAGVLANETDSLFTWQFDKDGKCPAGCKREGDKEGAQCMPE